MSKIQTLTSVASQLSFIFGALRSQPGGSLFAVVCLAKSLYASVSHSSLWHHSSCFRSLLFTVLLLTLVAPATYVWDSNPHYRRMRSLLKIVTESKHRVEVISDVLINYIQRGMFLSLHILNLFMFSEWKKARDLLGDESDDYPDSLLRLRRSNLLTFIDALQADFPLVRQLSGHSFP